MMKKMLALTIIMLLGLVVLSGCVTESPKPGDSNGQLDEIDNSNDDEKDSEQDKSTEEFVLENDAFKVYEPEMDKNNDQLIVRGLARVFEGTIQYEFEDGHYLFDGGYVTASEGAPGWGEFEIILSLDGVKNYSGTATVILYEESAKDGSRLHELFIPVEIPVNPYMEMNEAFKIYKPEMDKENGQLIVRGLARVFEATIQYEFEDGHYLFDKGFVTASEGAPGWGEFEIVLELEDAMNKNTTGGVMVILYEESAKDGSRLHEIHLPVELGE